RHDRTFDMPAGTARPPGAGPTGLAIAPGLPEHEIAGFFLVVFVHVHARAGFESDEIFAREAAVGGKAGEAEVDRAFALVGAAGRDQALNPGDHLGDEMGGAN